MKNDTKTAIKERKKAQKLQKLILAWEDINFASSAVEAFIKATPDKEAQKNCRDLKEHLFYSAVVSYSKMFVNSRNSKIGIVKKRDFEILKVSECKLLHEELLELRNQCVVHNDNYSQIAYVTWSQDKKIHFPQRARKIYWDISKARKIWALMKCLEKETLQQIYLIIKSENLQKDVSYKIENSIIAIS